MTYICGGDVECPSLSLPTVFPWDRISQEPEAYLFGLVLLASGLLRSAYLCLPVLGLQPCAVMPKFYVVLGIGTRLPCLHDFPLSLIGSSLTMYFLHSLGSFTDSPAVRKSSPCTFLTRDFQASRAMSGINLCSLSISQSHVFSYSNGG